jgi:hypothetical protein
LLACRFALRPETGVILSIRQNDPNYVTPFPFLKTVSNNHGIVGTTLATCAAVWLPITSCLEFRKRISIHAIAPFYIHASRRWSAGCLCFEPGPRHYENSYPRSAEFAQAQKQIPVNSTATKTRPGRKPNCMTGATGPLRWKKSPRSSRIWSAVC